jgi:hypothetical protein
MRLTTWLLVLTATGCASGPRATLPQLQQRAVHDLRCPAGYLQLAHIDQRTKLVSGCGRSLIYMEDCMEHGTDLLCSWRVDSPSQAMVMWRATPPPASPAAAPTGRVYRPQLEGNQYEHIEGRGAPPQEGQTGRKVKTDLFGDESTDVPPNVLDGRQ